MYSKSKNIIPGLPRKLKLMAILNWGICKPLDVVENFTLGSGSLMELKNFKRNTIWWVETTEKVKC